MKVVSQWMRVLIASVVLGLAPAAILAPSASAGSTAHSRASIVCPQLAGPPGCCGPITTVRRDALPCCPVPTTAACCPSGSTGTTCCTTTSCPSTLTVAVTPNPALDGKDATITGTLTGGTVAAQKVDLYERRAGQASFSDVASTQTNSAGAFSFTRAVTTNAQWYAKAGTATSSIVDQSILAAVALRPSSARPKAGAKVTLSGTVAPSHAGERVALQRLRKGRWVTIARPKLNARSRFAVVQKMRAHAVAHFRIVLAADSRNARSVSRVVVVSAR